MGQQIFSINIQAADISGFGGYRMVQGQSLHFLKAT